METTTMTPAKFAEAVVEAHEKVRVGMPGRGDEAIVQLAGLNARLVALLETYPHGIVGNGRDPGCDIALLGDPSDTCDGERNGKGENIGGFCWEHRLRALLAEIKGVG